MCRVLGLQESARTPSPHPAEKNLPVPLPPAPAPHPGEELLIPTQGRPVGIAWSCSVAAPGASGDSLSLCCVPRKGGAAAAGQAVTRGDTWSAGGSQASQWYFGGAEPLPLALLKLVDFPWASKAVSSFWGTMTSEF